MGEGDVFLNFASLGSANKSFVKNMKRKNKDNKFKNGWLWNKCTNWMVIIVRIYENKKDHKWEKLLCI